MLRLSNQTLQEYLTSYGWDFQQSPNRAFLTGWQGEKRSYPMKIILTDTWMLMQVKPLVRLGLDWQSWPQLTRFLLELNNDCHMVKISIDSQGDVVLGLQLFNLDLSYQQFSDGLGVVGYYAEVLFDQIQQRLKEIGYFASPSIHGLT